VRVDAFYAWLLWVACLTRTLSAVSKCVLAIEEITSGYALMLPGELMISNMGVSPQQGKVMLGFRYWACVG
jgi:hypothetical protein